MCSRGDHSTDPGGEIYQQFDLTPDEFQHWQDRWLNKVEEYYNLGR